MMRSGLDPGVDIDAGLTLAPKTKTSLEFFSAKLRREGLRGRAPGRGRAQTRLMPVYVAGPPSRSP